MNNYSSFFTEIMSSNSYVNSKKEPEYKKLMNNILIESFNIIMIMNIIHYY